jgi:hypothetical protein
VRAWWVPLVLLGGIVLSSLVADGRECNRQRGSNGSATIYNEDGKAPIPAMERSARENFLILSVTPPYYDFFFGKIIINYGRQIKSLCGKCFPVSWLYRARRYIDNIRRMPQERISGRQRSKIELSNSIPSSEVNRIRFADILPLCGGFDDATIDVNILGKSHPCAQLRPRNGRIGLHFVQLALHNGDKPSRFLISVSHGVPLKEYGDQRTGSDDSEDVSGGDEPSRNLYKRSLVGLFVISLGAALLRLSMELLYNAYESARLYPAAIACLVAAGLLILHGGFYICIGMWSLTGLYIL